MSLITKDLLINFLFIIFTLFLLQMIYLLKYSYRLKESKDSIFVVFPVLSLVLCMQFPVALGDSFVWDLRWIPFILGGLYGGYRLGLFLLAVLLILRYFMGNDGFYVACIIYPTIGALVFFISKYYLQLSIKHKVMVSTSLTFLTIISSMFVCQQIFELHIGISMWLQYVLISIIGMLITTLLLEVISTNFQVLQKLVKAEKLQMVSHLAANISHEVRNPLTVSRGFVQILSEDLPVHTRKKYTDIALKEMDRATEVINDYLTFAKPAIDNNEKIRVFEEIQYAINVITPLANMKGVNINLSLLNHDQYYVKGERKKFQQCLINILKNGIESMPTNGELQIHQIFNDTSIQIDIQDEGIGMSKEQINRLGEPYFTTKEKGTGLSMMVSFSIIKAMNGHISVSSKPGKGTCFSLKLPIYQYP